MIERDQSLGRFLFRVVYGAVVGMAIIFAAVCLVYDVTGWPK